MDIQEITEDTIVRILTSPYRGQSHKFGKLNIKCAIGLDITCTICDLLGKSKPFWLLGCINRNINDYMVYRIDYGTFTQLKKIVMTPHWGDPIKYDLEIKLGSVYTDINHTVLAKLPTPLSESDCSLKQKIDLEFIRLQTTPPSKEYFIDIEDRIKNKLLVLK